MLSTRLTLLPLSLWASEIAANPEAVSEKPLFSAVSANISSSNFPASAITKPDAVVRCHSESLGTIST
jgi:hypothetical protein